MSKEPRFTRNDKPKKEKKSNDIKRGDRVYVTGAPHRGHFGTVIEIRRPIWGFGARIYYVKLDGSYLGHTVVRHNRRGIRLDDI